MALENESENEDDVYKIICGFYEGFDEKICKKISDVCEDGCVETGYVMGKLGYGVGYIADEDKKYISSYCGAVCEDSFSTIDFINLAKRVSETKCFKYINEYGHPNYAVFEYAITKGHLDCIKKLYEICSKIIIDWHNGVAEIAATHGHFECLKFIVETMGDVDIEFSLDNVKDEMCKKYMEELRSQDVNKCK